MRIVFWGTPAFAVPALRALIGEAHEVTGVVTQPDRPAGRGRRIQPGPVKQLAALEGISVAQPERPQGDDFVSWLRDQNPDVSVVVAYGQIIDRQVLEVPRAGSINLHASLLPELRGAAPVQWAIARGHDVTGVTVMRMNERMDAGPILLQAAEPIGPEETGTDLAARLSEIGAEALVEALALMEADSLTETPQDDAQATFAPKIRKQDARIDWSESCQVVGRRIRAFDSVPGAWTTLLGEELKLFRPSPEHTDVDQAEPGTVVRVAPRDPTEGMLVRCGSGAIYIREIQPAGKRRMTTAEWLRGRDLEEGAHFE